MKEFSVFKVFADHYDIMTFDLFNIKGVFFSRKVEFIRLGTQYEHTDNPNNIMAMAVTDTGA